LGFGNESNVITELSKCFGELLDSPFGCAWRRRQRALFDITDPLMKNLPYDTSQPVGHSRNGSVVAETGEQTAEDNPEKTAL